MPSVKVYPSFVSIQEPRPSMVFGMPASVPIKSGTYEILTQIAMPSIPKGSTITSATYRVTQDDNWSGSVTLSLKRNLASWLSTMTWNGRPGVVAAATDTDTQSGTTAPNYWEFDVTDDVQGWYDRTIPHNWGWTLRTNSSTKHHIRGKKAAYGQPVLTIFYELSAAIPTNLSPAGGSVSVAKPVVTFDVSSSTTAVQVQIDPAADAASPDFDSGQVNTTGGSLDLAATAYAGLADGDSTYWRARAKSAAGWSRWSTWVQFSRDDLPAVSLISPGATTADTSPPFEWSFGGTQTAWRTDLFLVTGSTPKLLRSSGLRSGADNDWTPDPLTGSYFGKTLRARVRVFDDVDRIATPGAHTYSEDSVEFVASFTATVAPMDTLTATTDALTPGITLSGTRAAGVPDELAIFHGDEMVARIDGADAFTTSTDFEFTDWWGRMGVETTITVVPIVNGDFADDSPTAVVTPRCLGLWLVDPATGTAIVLWGTDQGSTEAPDLAAEMQTTDGYIVRRRLANASRTGSHSGDIVDVGTLAADDILDAFETFRANDAATVYRLVRGRENLPVIAGNFLTTPTPLENLQDQAWSTGSFSWWESTSPTYVDGG